MRILLIEDDHALARTMLDMLRDDQHAVDWLDDGQHAVDLPTDEKFDVIVLDLTLPRVDGLKVLESLRAKGVMTPIIILTARSELADRLKGLDAGADDYLTKPFAMSELKARIRAVTRRHDGMTSQRLTVGSLSLDTESGELSIGEQSMILHRSEFRILQYLMRHPDQVATRRRLEEQLYGWEEGVESNAMEVHIHHLRKRIGKETIRTIRGVGYLLDSRAAAGSGAPACP